MKRIVAGSDHAGLALRAAAVRMARQKGFEVEDLGPFSEDRVDYPDYARQVAEAVVTSRACFGILVCGTGIGMSIAANKVKGIRAACCSCEYQAHMARAHNDANVLCLGERVIGAGVASAIVEAFLTTPFEGGRHQQRVEQIHALEK